MIPLVVSFMISNLQVLMEEEQLRIYMLDVGQGDSCLVKSKDLTVLIDGGGDMNLEGENIGIKVLIPFLMDKGVRHIDMVVVSHLHFDHVKGIIEIMGYVDIDKLVLPKVYLDVNQEDHELYSELLKKVEEEKVELLYVEAGQILSKDDVKFRTLYPEPGQKYDQNENHNSLVLKLEYMNFSVLFTGDIEEEDESALLKSGWDLRSDALKVAHHGSNSSSSEQFLEKVCPEIGLISYGYNTFGHPSDIVKLRYKNMEIPLYSTKNCGMIEMVIFDDRYKVIPYRGVLTDETAKRPD